MRVAFSALSSILTALAVSASTAPAITPNQVPQFETLFFGEFQVAAVNSLNGPFGTRLDIVLNGGNLTDTSGNPVASLLPAASDTGVISDSGIFFPIGVLPLRWAVDQKLAYLHVSGVGVPFQSDVVYVHLETDSETWSSLNSRFLVANVTFPGGEGSNLIFTLFGLL